MKVKKLDIPMMLFSDIEANWRYIFAWMPPEQYIANAIYPILCLYNDDPSRDDEEKTRWYEEAIRHNRSFHKMRFQAEIKGFLQEVMGQFTLTVSRRTRRVLVGHGPDHKNMAEAKPEQVIDTFITLSDSDQHSSDVRHQRFRFQIQERGIEKIFELMEKVYQYSLKFYFEKHPEHTDETNRANVFKAEYFKEFSVFRFQPGRGFLMEKPTPERPQHEEAFAQWDYPH